MDEDIGLFPVFDVPDMDEEEDIAEEQYKRSVFFDIETGDFRMDGAGRMTEATGYEAYMQWCVKVVNTPRYSCLAYPEEIGTEMDEALEEETHEAVESSVEREITEALMVNPRTESVKNFEFTWGSGSLYCSFTVQGLDYEEFEIENVEIGIGG